MPVQVSSVVPVPDTLEPTANRRQRRVGGRRQRRGVRGVRPRRDRRRCQYRPGADHDGGAAGDVDARGIGRRHRQFGAGAFMRDAGRGRHGSRGCTRVVTPRCRPRSHRCPTPRPRYWRRTGSASRPRHRQSTAAGWCRNRYRADSPRKSVWCSSAGWAASRRCNDMLVGGVGLGGVTVSAALGHRSSPLVSSPSTNVNRTAKLQVFLNNGRRASGYRQSDIAARQAYHTCLGNEPGLGMIIQPGRLAL